MSYNINKLSVYIESLSPYIKQSSYNKMVLYIGEDNLSSFLTEELMLLMNSLESFCCKQIILFNRANTNNNLILSIASLLEGHNKEVKMTSKFSEIKGADNYIMFINSNLVSCVDIGLMDYVIESSPQFSLFLRYSKGINIYNDINILKTINKQIKNRTVWNPMTHYNLVN